MITFWLPDVAGGTYQLAAAEALERVDVTCGPCGTHRPRLVGHFVRPGPGAPVGVLAFTAEGSTQGPAFWLKRGVLRWRLYCPSGHNANLTLDSVVKLLDDRRARVSVWPDGRISV